MLNVKSVSGWMLIVLAAAAIVPACKNHGGDTEEEKKGEFTLTYSAAGMTGVTVPSPVKDIAYGAEVTLQAFAGTLPAPYTFYLWNTSAGGEGTWFTPGAKIVVTEDMTLFAIYDGDGSTMQAPKIVDTAEGMIKAIEDRTQINETGWSAASGFYKQTKDIDFTGMDFVPLADEFKGLYDGAGYTISGINADLTVDPEADTDSEKVYGLFRWVGSSDGGGIKNLVVEGNINASGNGLYVGLLAGKVDGGFIENCAAIGTVTVNGNDCHAGLLAGHFYGSYAYPGTGSKDIAEGNAYIKNCYAVGTVTLQGDGGYAGGLVGEINGVWISDCFTIADVTGGELAGGITGFIDYGNGHSAEEFASVNLASLGTRVTAAIEQEEIDDGHFNAKAAGKLFGYIPSYRSDVLAPLFYNSDMTVTPEPSMEYGATEVTLSDTQVYVSDTDNWWTQNMNFAFGTSDDSPWQWDAENKRPKLWFEK